MHRRSRPVVYDDVMDDMEEIYMKGEPVQIDRDLRYAHGHGHGHRMPRAPGPPPPPPAVEILPDRRNHRGRSKPEYLHEDLEYLRDDVLAAERRARLDLDAYRAEEARKLKEEVFNTYEPRLRHQPQPRHRGRRRSKISDVEEVYFSHDDSDHDHIDSESDEMDEFIEKKRSMSRNELDPRKGPLPRSKSLKEEKRAQRSVYGDGLYPKNSRSLEEYERERKGPRPNAVTRPRHRSHYHVDLESEETDESDESVDVIPQRGGRGVVRRNHVEQERYSARRRETSSLSSSSPESAGSSADELPKVPLPVPVPPVYKESSRRHKPLGHAPVHQISRPPSPPSPPRSPSPPRVPSLETVLNERELRHRKKLEKAAKEEIEIERRSRESLQLSSDSRPRRKKGKPIAIVEQPEVAERRELLVEAERADPRVTYKEREREIIEEDYRRSSPHSDSTDDWAIVSAPSKYSPEREPPVVDVREEPSRPRHKRNPVKPPIDEVRDPKPKGDNPRGKVGPRYIGIKDRRERLWTEITKELVVREAIERAGYEYEELDTSYYIFSYLHPDDVSALIEDSDNIRGARRRRIQEIQRERASMPLPSSSR
ncbi:uncharacterized protein DSM5745_07625 [Aspergillus mulundensis]|uniref:DUF8035 domain-containing protein n=1 Tax=Aspergillus mulundensis TaxID=1810919 RepID=A0A3D8REG4_9EURO|nr:hypothetical protein DSM5745_07625 [Aspergillus mulundensis]RDW72453.1 hypothetical protein DSM5745_07625 [Aspergillus mulundensis]